MWKGMIIMEDKQVMNRKTSSKELHLISCGWEKCTRETIAKPDKK